MKLNSAEISALLLAAVCGAAILLCGCETQTAYIEGPPPAYTGPCMHYDEANCEDGGTAIFECKGEYVGYP